MLAFLTIFHFFFSSSSFLRKSFQISGLYLLKSNCFISIYYFHVFVCYFNSFSLLFLMFVIVLIYPRFYWFYGLSHLRRRKTYAYKNSSFSRDKQADFIQFFEIKGGVHGRFCDSIVQRSMLHLLLLWTEVTPSETDDVRTAMLPLLTCRPIHLNQGLMETAPWPLTFDYSLSIVIDCALISYILHLLFYQETRSRQLYSAAIILP